MLLRNRNSATATPQSQYFLKSTTSNLQLESFTSAIFGIFLAVESGRFMQKKIGGKTSRATAPLRQFLFSREKQTVLQIFWVEF
jgi:hypothetical protein